MPSVETEQTENLNIGDDANRADKTLSGPIIGIIYPPPEVRSMLNLKITNFSKLFLIKFPFSIFNSIKLNYLQNIRYR